MKVELLTVPACPSRALALQRITEAFGLAAWPAPAVAERVIDDPEVAASAGMHGSPTILIDGTDPFATGDEPSVSCRLYDNADGLSGAPSVADLLAVITSEAAP